MPVEHDFSKLGLPSSIDIIEKISQGGMGAVYKAKHNVTGAILAVKILLPQHSERENYISRFIREARAACTLSNPHIVSVHDCGTTTDGLPYIVMDYVQGGTLEDVLNKQGHLKSEDALDIFIQTADALAHAHKRGIVHRDIKPSNIMLAKGDNGGYFVKMVDFGIAKITNLENAPPSGDLTITGEVLGTPTYMSPEQCVGGKLDGRSDIYSLGCVMYHTLVGKPPFTGATTLHVLVKHSRERAPSISFEDKSKKVPKGLETVISKCLEKAPQDRYATMEDVIKDLQKVKDGESITIRITGYQKWMLGIVGKTILSAIVGFLVAWGAVMLMSNFGH